MKMKMKNEKNKFENEIKKKLPSPPLSRKLRCVAYLKDMSVI